MWPNAYLFHLAAYKNYKWRQLCHVKVGETRLSRRYVLWLSGEATSAVKQTRGSPQKSAASFSSFTSSNGFNSSPARTLFEKPARRQCVAPLEAQVLVNKKTKNKWMHLGHLLFKFKTLAPGVIEISPMCPGPNLHFGSHWIQKVSSLPWRFVSEEEDEEEDEVEEGDEAGDGWRGRQWWCPW